VCVGKGKKVKEVGKGKKWRKLGKGRKWRRLKKLEKVKESGGGCEREESCEVINQNPRRHDPNK
jgi:hypothetical protein